MDKGISDEEAEDLEEVWKEPTDIMVTDSKPHFTNI